MSDVCAARVIIIGKHPLTDSLLCQYQSQGREVDCHLEMNTDGICINDYAELCLLAGNHEDDKAVALIGQLAADYQVEDHSGNRLLCHLLLQKNETLRILQTTDFCESIREKVDVYPFTMDEVWSRSIILDYEPMTIQSQKHVHLVVFGMGEIAEMVAIQAAQVAHYPNYVRDHSLRTRITMIDTDAEQKSKGFIKRFQHLFDNSYYRIVKPSEEHAVTLFHQPMYERQREEFVDVEWEFVEADISNTDLRAKLQLWAKDSSQLLTIVMADNDQYKNRAQVMCLPDDIFQQNIPVHSYSKPVSGYDINLPLVRMAKNVNYIYNRCYHDNIVDWNGTLRYAVEIDKDESERFWAELPAVKRMSSIYNAMTIPVKMRSIGLNEDDWGRFYDISQQDIELLTEVEHNRWSVEELILGYRPCTDVEQQQIEADINLKNVYKAKKIHYDLRSFNDLRIDETGKSVKIYDLCLCSCLPLIAKVFADENQGTAVHEDERKGGEA